MSAFDDIFDDAFDVDVILPPTPPAPDTGPPVVSRALDAGSGFSFAPSVGTDGSGDMLIDPVTLDYVRTDDGRWQEIGDSRTTMMIMLELELGASPYDPQDGTRIKAMTRSGDPVTAEDALEDALRAARILVSAGTISDLKGATVDALGKQLVDQRGKPIIRLDWRDLASGAAQTLLVSP